MIKKYGAILLFSLLISWTELSLAAFNTIYVYNDQGASQESLAQTQQMFKTFLPKNYKVKWINAEAIKQKAWTQDAALLVMPGGADIPYANKLNGAGNQIIKHYVKNGGAFLGICAGGYYGSSFVEFDKKGPLQVLSSRELQFFPGKAIGPVLATYDYQSNSGARAANIKLSDDSSFAFYYNGGGFFPKANTYRNVTVLGWYQMPDHNPLPAIIKIKYGRGRVILSGVHFEYAPETLNEKDPFLANIIPVLKTTSTERKHFVVNTLKVLGLQAKNNN